MTNRHGEVDQEKYFTHRRKLRLDNPIAWPHHRSGWADVVGLLQDQLHCSDGTKILTSFEESMVSGEVIDEPWVGFAHEVPHHGRSFPDLARILLTDTWKYSKENCRGIWVLTTYQKNFLECQIECPVAVVRYPTAAATGVFDFGSYLRQARKTVVCIGEYLRDIAAFVRLDCPSHRKILIGAGDALSKFDPRCAEVENLGRISNSAYDDLLTTAIVFLRLVDAPANTTIIECISRSTPVLVNRVGAVEEYLGQDYPMYYTTLEDAHVKLLDDDLIARTVLYMRSLPMRSEITYAAFVRSLQNTAIYRSLPVPHSQQQDFKSFDVTIMVCSYHRTRDLPEVLRRLGQQDFEGSIEIIVWNNSIEHREEVDDAVAAIVDAVDVKTIHSTENFYCVARLAASTLMRSDLLLICDDDILPEDTYVQRFVTRSRILGPDVVICARGNRLLPHVLDEEDPSLIWTTGEFTTFYDESEDDRFVHYFHADVCIMPRALLLRAVRYEMPRADFALVDDYWLSFVFSHHLHAQLFKMKCDDTFTRTTLSDDPTVALYRNPRVREELVNMYIHHMRLGWPWTAGRVTAVH